MMLILRVFSWPLLFVSLCCCLLVPMCIGFSVNNHHDNTASNAVQQQRLLPGIWRLWFDTASDDEENDNILSFLLPSYTTQTLKQERIQHRKEQQSKDDDDELDDEKSAYILIKINPDGSFRQCTEYYQEGRWLSGQWKIVPKENSNDDDDDSSSSRSSSSRSSITHSLLLALDRQYYGPSMDILLQGNLMLRQQPTFTSAAPTAATTATTASSTANSTSTVRLIQGNVWTGKFMYPKRHGQFFEQQQPPPLPPALISSCPVPKCVGTFTMQQAISTSSVSTTSAESESSSSILTLATTAAKPKYKASDFYGRCFILTVEPIALTTKQRQREQQQQQREQQQQPMTNDDNDIRAMPIQFYPNNTFAAIHTNKILRGRFGVVSTTTTTTTTVPTKTNGNTTMGGIRDELWFQVSLFGSGRSVRGSVYSEGIGLSHHDQRSYVGEILEHNIMQDEEGTATSTGHNLEQARQAKTIGSTAQPSDEEHQEEQQKQQQQQRQRLFVAGSVTYGSDLGSDARPEPVGTFQLTEIATFCEKDGLFGLLRAEDDDDDNEDDDDRQENGSENTEDGTQDNETSDSVFQ